MTYDYDGEIHLPSDQRQRDFQGKSLTLKVAPDSRRIIFKRRLVSRDHEDFKRGRYTGNVSARDHSDTVVSLTQSLRQWQYITPMRIFSQDVRKHW